MTNEKGKIRERKLCIWRCNYRRVNACCALFIYPIPMTWTFRNLFARRVN